MALPCVHHLGEFPGDPDQRLARFLAQFTLEERASAATLAEQAWIWSRTRPHPVP